MKGKFRLVGLDRICRLLGVTRQSYYQYHWRSQTRGLEQELVLKQVHHIRKKHRHMGGRKLYGLLSPFMREHRIKMGRDALFDLLSAHFLLVSKKRKQVRTTQSFHWLRKYPNLIKALVPTRANQLWVSDITYWKIEAGFVYIRPSDTCAVPVFPDIANGIPARALLAVPSVTTARIDACASFITDGLQILASITVGSNCFERTPLLWILFTKYGFIIFPLLATALYKVRVCKGLTCIA